MKHRTSVGPKTVDPAEKMPIISFTMATIEMIAVESIGANAMLRGVLKAKFLNRR